MPSLCSICEKEVSRLANQKVICKTCSKIFHADCLNIAPDDLNSIKKDYNCQLCTDQVEENENQHSSSFIDRVNFFNESRWNILNDNMDNDLSISSSKSLNESRKDKWEDKIDKLVTDMSEIKKILSENLELKNKVNVLENKINILETKINKLEQNKLKKYGEITGLPIINETNVKKML